MEKTGQIEIRLLDELDLPAALRLKELARWNQTESDWKRLLCLEPRGCFCATIAGRVVGTTTTTTYGREVAWIGMVLVDPEYRRCGIATRLMHAALDYLLKARVTAVKLDATTDGRPVYEKLGFKMETLIERWAGVAVSPVTVARSTLDASARGEVFALDRLAFRADRSRLIEMLVEDACVAPLVARTPDGLLTGYGLARGGTDAAYVGPLVATISDEATALLDGLLSELEEERVYIDVNTDFKSAREVLTRRGFVKQRDLIRMSYGKESGAGCSQDVFAIAGPEFG